MNRVWKKRRMAGFLAMAAILSLLIFCPGKSKAAQREWVTGSGGDAVYKYGNSYVDGQGYGLIEVGEKNTVFAGQSHYGNITGTNWTVDKSHILKIVRTNGQYCTVTGVSAGTAKLVGNVTSWYTDPMHSMYDIQTYANPFQFRVVEPIRTLKLSAENLSLKPGETKILKIDSYQPASIYSSFYWGIYDRSGISYTSSNPAVVTVDAGGNLKAIGSGTAVVTLSVKDRAKIHEDVKASCTVTVSKNASDEPKGNDSPGTGPDSGKYAEETLYVGEKFSAGVTGAFGLTWSSSNPKVAAVSANGRITAKKQGVAQIIAKTKSGKAFYCNITVKSVLSVSKTKVSIAKGKSKKITAVYRRKKGSITCRVREKSIVSCKRGKRKGGKFELKITAKKKGTATIIIGNTFSPEKKKIKVTVR